MKKTIITCCLFLVAISPLFAQKNSEIPSNKLVSDITIKLTANNSVLPKDVIFSLEEYGMQANAIKASMTFRIMSMTSISGAMKEFNSGKIIAYDILITNPRFSKPYYGKIAFFNVLKRSENDAVARYREISIDDSYFTSATKGRVAITYEYAVISNSTSSVEIPTWVVMLSDVPFR